MNLKEEKRPPIVINNWPQAPAPILPVIMPHTPYWPHDTIIACENPRIEATCLSPLSVSFNS